MLPTFHWTTFDVSGMLPPYWQNEVRGMAAEAEFKDFPRTPVVSREGTDVDYIPRGRVHADQVVNGLPWLRKFYQCEFRELAEIAAGERVAAARDKRYGVVLNVQHGTVMKFECHVDSNPLSGLLFCSDHALGGGGELAIANNTDAASVAEVDRSCAEIRSQSGHLVFFDGRRHPHYVRPLTSSNDIRIVAVMNYYTRSVPESTRPPELNRHLYGDQ